MKDALSGAVLTELRFVEVPGQSHLNRAADTGTTQDALISLDCFGSMHAPCARGRGSLLQTQPLTGGKADAAFSQQSPARQSRRRAVQVGSIQRRGTPRSLVQLAPRSAALPAVLAL